MCQLGGNDGILFMASCYAGKPRQPGSGMTCTNCEPFLMTVANSASLLASLEGYCTKSVGLHLSLGIYKINNHFQIHTLTKKYWLDKIV